MRQAETFNQKYTECQALLAKPGSIFVKYETLVLNFPAWLAKVAQGFAIDNERFISKMSKKYAGEFAVKKENIHAHKRKIVPGDYREKLAAETIASLNAIFAENLQRYGYEI